MILLFNKQYRQENALISDLAKKIKKSETLKREIRNNDEIYKLDTIKITFSILDRTIVVSENKPHGQNIVSMDCKFVNGYSEADELQRARFSMFSRLIEMARQTYNKKLEKTKEFEKGKERVRNKKKSLEQIAAEKAVAEAAITNARQKLKSL
jgi:Ser/Thr protein kinase RdoA (MazF antagonist)